MPFHSTYGEASKRPSVTCVLATSTGVSSGSSNSGAAISRRRACAENGGKRGSCDGYSQAAKKEHHEDGPKTRGPARCRESKKSAA